MEVSRGFRSSAGAERTARPARCLRPALRSTSPAGPTRVGAGQGKLPFTQEGTEKNRNLPTHNRLTVTEAGKSHRWQTAGCSHNLKSYTPDHRSIPGTLKVKSGRHRVDRQGPVLRSDTGLGLLEWPLFLCRGLGQRSCEEPAGTVTSCRLVACPCEGHLTLLH